MPRPLDPSIAKVFKEMDMDPKEAVWDCHGTWVAYHRALERVAAIKGIRFDRPAVIEADGENKIAAICVFGKMGDREEWSIGEAAPGNNKNAYPWAMAEKRAKDRVILKLIGLSGLAYSEEEADDFKQHNTPTNGAVKVEQSNVSKHNWTGPLTKTKLSEELRRLRREFQDAFDNGDIDAFMALKNSPETKDIIKQAKVDMPLEWAGPMQDGEPYAEMFAALEKGLRECNPMMAG